MNVPPTQELDIVAPSGPSPPETELAYRRNGATPINGAVRYIRQVRSPLILGSMIIMIGLTVAQVGLGGEHGYVDVMDIRLQTPPTP